MTKSHSPESAQIKLYKKSLTKWVLVSFMVVFSLYITVQKFNFASTIWKTIQVEMNEFFCKFNPIEINHSLRQCFNEVKDPLQK